MLLPRLVAEGLAANDWAKVRMSGLQSGGPSRELSRPRLLTTPSVEARAAGSIRMEFGRFIREARVDGTDAPCSRRARRRCRRSWSPMSMR